MNAIAVQPSSGGMTTSARMNALVPTSMAEAISLADIMAKANLLPDHLRGKPGDCLLVIMQAQRWGMDPVSVAQCTSVVRGKLCYEGKLVAAALYATGSVEGRIKYTYSGTGRNRKVVVSALPRGETDAVSVEGTVEQWATDNKNWTANPDDMLAYRGARQWARRHAPEALLGVYTPDEIEDVPDVQVVQAKIQMPQPRAAAVLEHQEVLIQSERGINSAQAGDSEPGFHGLSESQKRIVIAKAKAAGLDEASVLDRFKRIDSGNLNDVLAELRGMAEQEQAQ